MVGERKFAIFSQARRRRLCGGLVLPRHESLFILRPSVRPLLGSSIAFHYVVGKRENQPRTEAGGGRGGGGTALCEFVQGLVVIEEEFCA